MKIKPLPWDSDFFGISVGELGFSELDSEIEDLLSAADNPELLYLRYRGSTGRNLTKLERISTCCVHQITFERSLLERVDSATSFSIVETSELSEPLIDLAIAAGEYSRFHQDPRLRKYFDAMYREWISKSLNGAIADKVFICENNNTVCGLITISYKRTSVATVGLLSVDATMRGQGVAKSLLHAAEKWAILNGAASMKIATQSTNIAAVKFYSKSGYVVCNSEYIFHLWKEDLKNVHSLQ